MNELTLFFSKLLTNADKLAQFNSGSCAQEIAANRQNILTFEGIKDFKEITKVAWMNAEELIKFMRSKTTNQASDIASHNTHSISHSSQILNKQKTINNVNNESFQQQQYNSEETICGLIHKQMQEHPSRIAIIDCETTINFTQLMQKANAIAGELEDRNIEPGALVGVCLHRSWELVATLIGVMQAGCAYVPLDPTYPKDRVRYMLKHSRAVAAFVDDDASANLCEEVRELLRIDEINGTKACSIKPSADDLAYVIYTSGSTGKPKGVAVEHRNIVAMSQSMGVLLNDEELSGVFAGASACFDTSVMETLGTLSLGGTVILAKNALELPKLPYANQIKTCVMVPSSMQALLLTDKLPANIRCVIFGGEALKRSLVEQIHALESGPRVVNAYGPTEDTVYSTIKEVMPGTEVITIGKSVNNSRSYILDGGMQPVAPGEAGELYLAGNKLARGYLYDTDLTDERFIKFQPNELTPNERIYKTGDLCRWTECGEIEFLGRVDQQVKIRGFRIELEEIESTLESMPGIDAAAAAAITGGSGQKLLAVYVVTKKETLTDATVKGFLANRLPQYMVPQIVIRLKQLPLLPNEKLDRNKLMNLEENHFFEHPAVNSDISNTVEFQMDFEKQQPTTLSIIQQQVASLLNFSDPNQIPPDQLFNDIGLDSLTILELSGRLSKILKQKLPPQVIEKHNSPNALAKYMMGRVDGRTDDNAMDNQPSEATNSLASFQKHIQSSHPTFQAAKVSSWCVMDKSKLVQEVLLMVNDLRRNPYSKVLTTGSASRGMVADVYNDDQQEAIIWTTNLYLALNRDKKVMQESIAALKRYGTGMGTSAAASGLTNLHLEFENEFAELVGKPSACLFPTGYTANVGVVAGLLGKNDVVVVDQLCHASIVDGARLSGATIRTFKHNDISDLESVLKSEVSPYHSILVALEGVYSMGEGAAPVAEIIHMAKKYNALVLVDEAHSFGFYGKRGAGICAAQGVTDQVDFIMTTLSKALGSLGGVIAAKREYIDLLKSSARAYIFQASVSPADIAASLTALRRLSTDDQLREQLWETTRYMRQRFEDAGYDLGSGDGPIITPHFSDKDKLFAIVQELYKRGVQTSAVTYPIVESGRGRLRLICSAAHTKKDVDKTLQALIEAEQAVDKMLMTVKDEPKDANLLVNSEVQDWAKSFFDYLQKSAIKTAEIPPDLALIFNVGQQPEPLKIILKDGSITFNAELMPSMPSCSLHLTDKTAVKALCSSDVQSLLKNICKGACVLSGQVEPFVWFIGRMVDQQRESKPEEASIQ